jgi:Tol biopolymer transport system component
VYEVTALIGEGGMGQVYRATDTVLKRQVAIKTLPDLVANDPERLARFQREAEVLAALNHPNIAQIYGVEGVDGVRGLVMELVDGPTLADRIAQGPIPIDEALPIAKQVAEALEAAHEQGIIHRDLKPANIKVREDGTVKVLDFGLAKAMDPSSASSASLSMSPTITTPAMTQMGMILGTAAYMSPEQARGKPVDKRADVWAFGCVLYEMLTAKPVFGGETVTDVAAAILRNEPDWSALPANTPPPVRALLRRCLQKDIKARLPHIGVARLEIDDAQTGTSPTPSQTRWIRSGGVIASWVITAVAAAVAIGLGVVVAGHRGVPPAGAVRLAVSTASGLTLGTDIFGRGASAPAPQFGLSPDGRTLVFVGYKASQKPQLWVRRLDSESVSALSGTDEASFPFWSPDSQFVGFFAQGKLKKIDLAGGPPVAVCDAPAGEGGTWNRDGTIVFAADDVSGLSRVSAGGGVATPLTRLDGNEVSHRWPQFLPDGRHVMYLALENPQRDRRTDTAASLDSLHAIYVASLDAPDRTLVMRGVLRTLYAGGHLLFLRGSTLMAQPFDARTLRPMGDPEPIAEGVANNTGNGRTAFAASDTLLAYRVGPVAERKAVLAWFDRSGKRLGTIGTTADYIEAQLSPDGKSIGALIGNRAEAAIIGPGPQAADLWILDLTRDAIPIRATFHADEPKSGLVWSPDGSRIAFGSGGPRVSGGGIYGKPVGDVREPELLFTSEGGQRPTGWSPDRRFLAFNQIDARLHRDVWILPLFGDRKPMPFLRSPFNQEAAVFSPDGRRVAYASDKGGSFDVYVRTFPEGDREWRVSHDGGNLPQWRADGRELFFVNPLTRAVMAAPIKSGTPFEPGPPVKLIDTAPFREEPILGNVAYSVTPDGQRLLMIQRQNASPDLGEESSALKIVLNWQEELKRHRPSK